MQPHSLGPRGNWAEPAFHRHKFGLLESRPCAQITQRLTHNATPLDSQTTRGSSAATYTSHRNGHCVHCPPTLLTQSNFPVSPSLGAQCREHGPSVTIPRSRHMTITVHLPLTATSHIQPKSDSIPAPGCLPTETSHSQETLHLQPSRILLPKHLNYQIHPQCTVVHTGLGNK